MTVGGRRAGGEADHQLLTLLTTDVNLERDLLPSAVPSRPRRGEIPKWTPECIWTLVQKLCQTHGEHSV
jgi:hypothetical protein